MPKLFTYCMTNDTGAAPNPFGGVCSLNICKPVIRRVADVNDWIVGTGSTEFGFENQVVYAMQVTEKLTMQEYYERCVKQLQGIYDFSTEPTTLLQSVHKEGNRVHDLGGKYTLLSTNFYYFGDSPVLLPHDLLPIVRQGQGHKSTSNKPYVDPFLDWIITQKKARNKVYAEPNDRHRFALSNDHISQCAIRDKEQDAADESLGDE
jgi:hypothetical protein